MATMKVLLATSFLKPFRWCREPKEYTLLIMEFNEAEERTELYWLKLRKLHRYHYRNREGFVFVVDDPRDAKSFKPLKVEIEDPPYTLILPSNAIGCRHDRPQGGMRVRYIRQEEDKILVFS